MKSIEDNILALGFLQNAAASNTEHPQGSASLTAANTFKADGKRFQLISLYEQRLKRGLKDDVEMLRGFQAERKAQRDQVAQVPDLPRPAPAVSTPAPNGSVFSTPTSNVGQVPGLPTPSAVNNMEQIPGLPTPAPNG